MIDAYDTLRGEGCYPVLVVLDEIFRTGMPKLPEYSTTVCGRNISLLTTAQSKSQLDAAYGKYKADNFLDRWIVRSSSTRETRQRDRSFIEEALGYIGLLTRNEHENGTVTVKMRQKYPRTNT
jgi:type IV secretory pathway TraG/TraD family ATPase VirD4